jgi:predicted esterase
MKRDIFISHSSEDKKFARKLRTYLESAGYSCWMAPDDVKGPETFTEQIMEAIDECKVIIVNEGPKALS